MSHRRVFVTGASGFVGNAIVPELVARGYALRGLRHRGELPTGVSETVGGSLARVSDLESALENVDAVVHSAALLDPIDDQRQAETINHRATVELAAIAARAGARCFVFLSSLAAVGYRDGAGLVKADAPCRPTTIYGKSKLDAERALSALDGGRMRRVILRPPTVYGPGERRNFLALVRAIDTGYFVIPGDGKNRMSFCSAKNLAHAVGHCLDHDGATGIVNVADEPVATFRESVETIAAALDRKLLPLPFPLPVARAVATGLELGFRFAKRAPPLNRARLRTLTADCALDTSENARIDLIPITRFADAVRETIIEYRNADLVGRP
jgi:nucleoside-diphosphate-sugar epimerase